MKNESIQSKIFTINLVIAKSDLRNVDKEHVRMKIMKTHNFVLVTNTE